jgi:exosortase/archaeosortase family protein
MKYDRNSAIAAMMLCIIILLATSFYITPAGISDTDPSTYVVVPILMLPLFILFTFKSDIEPAAKRRDVAIGATLFAAFIALTVILRIYFSFYFISFRLDLLLIPLAIAALASILFGVFSIGRFKGAMAYAILASPSLIYPLFKTSGAFAQINTIAVYDVIKLFIAGVHYSAPITIAANGYNIGIGTACVSIGIFLALAFFLIPIAYLYDGKAGKKALWVASGIVLLLVLNLVRMTSISLVWLAYGPNQTALFVHTFIGVVLFYVVIALMILISRFYGLEIRKAKKSDKKKRKQSEAGALGVVIAIAFSLAYLLLTLNYSSSTNVSAMAIAQRSNFNFTNLQISDALSNMVAKGNFNTIMISDPHGTYAVFSMWNATIDPNLPITLMAMGPNDNETKGMMTNSTLLGTKSFFNSNGVTENVYDLVYQMADYVVYNTQIPLSIANQSSQITSIYIVIPVIDLPTVTCSGYDKLYSAVANIANIAEHNQTVISHMDEAECFSNKIVWS